MKTIKLVAVVLALTFYACSESDEITYLPEVNNKWLYTIEEYYEPTVKVDYTTTNKDISGFFKDYSYVGLGYAPFTRTDLNYETLDTLVINGFKMDNVNRLIFLPEYSNPNQFTHSYKKIKYLKIINFKKDLYYIFETGYDKIKVGDSNISIDKLNATSRTIDNVSKPLFEKIEMKKNRITFVVDYDNQENWIGSGFYNFIKKPIGFVSYEHQGNKGKKYELVSIAKQ